MKIETKQGSATSPVPGKNGVIIAHLCNSVGAWGKGFVLAVDKLSPIPRKAYKEMAQRHSNNIPLGKIQFLEVEPNLWVVNMVAQNGIDKSISPNGCLVDYKALNECLKLTFERAVLLGCNVHIPSGMGSGLAGGDEQMVHDLIETRAKCHSIDSLEDQLQSVPQITLWEFDDTTAASYIGKPTKPLASDAELDDLDSFLDDL